MRGSKHHSNPNALSQLPSDVAQPVDAIEAERFQPTVAEHARHLGILCKGKASTRALSSGTRDGAAAQCDTLPILLECQLTLRLRIVLSSATVLAALALRTSRWGQATRRFAAPKYAT